MSSRMIWVLAVLAACGSGGDGGTGPNGQPTPVAAVTVTPSDLSIVIGSTAQLRAHPRDAAGAQLFGRAVTWSSSNTTIATVSNAGVVSAHATGSVSITATSEGKTGTATVAATGPVSLAAIMGTWTGLVTEVQPCCLFEYTTAITIPTPGPVAPGALAGTITYYGGALQCSGDLSLRAEGPNFLEFSERITAGTGCAAVTTVVRLGPFASDGVRLRYSAQGGNSTATALLSRSP